MTRPNGSCVNALNLECDRKKEVANKKFFILKLLCIYLLRELL